MARERYISKGINLRTPWSSARLRAGTYGVGAIALLVGGFILLTLIGLALIIAAIWVIVINVQDINNVGVNFWNVFWIVLASLVLLGGLRNAVSG